MVRVSLPLCPCPRTFCVPPLSLLCSFTHSHTHQGLSAGDAHHPTACRGTARGPCSSPRAACVVLGGLSACCLITEPSVIQCLCYSVSQSVSVSTMQRAPERTPQGGIHDAWQKALASILKRFAEQPENIGGLQTQPEVLRVTVKAATLLCAHPTIAPTSSHSEQ